MRSNLEYWRRLIPDDLLVRYPEIQTNPEEPDVPRPTDAQIEQRYQNRTPTAAITVKQNAVGVAFADCAKVILDQMAEGSDLDRTLNLLDQARKASLTGLLDEA